jgi:hypothetical protein
MTPNRSFAHGDDERVCPSSSYQTSPDTSDTTGRSQSPVARHRATGTAFAVFLFVSATACALDPHYNPDQLGAPEVARLATICEGVMGLNPSEHLRDNLWPGDPDPASSTNDYRGCMASLSRSLRDIRTSQAVSQAHENCRTDQREDGTSDFSACVLRTFEARQGRGRAQTVSQTLPLPGKEVIVSAGTSVPKSVARERLACAQIGLVVGQEAFASCVSRLADVLRARQMDALYTN